MIKPWLQRLSLEEKPERKTLVRTGTAVFYSLSLIRFKYHYLYPDGWKKTGTG
jgi:hypothetical protein